MKIKNMQENQEEKGFSMTDLTEVFLDLQKLHRNVFIHQIEDEVFLYRSLGRSEYKKMIEDDRFDPMAKEELICQVCVLFPEEYDFEECSAGVPTVLSKAIIKNSFLDSIDSRNRILGIYREEMFDLENQITCIINEAFPQFDIEEIEEWDTEKTTKYLSRAEWKLHNLRGLQFYDTDSQESYYEKNEPPVQQEEINHKNDAKNIRGGKKEKFTPEKLRELKEKFPEINWEADTIITEGLDGMKDSVDVIAPALRPGK